MKKRSFEGFRPAARPVTALLALSLLTLGACSDGGAPTSGPQGVFLLTVFDGKSIPATPAKGCCIWTGGSVELKESRYVLKLTFSQKGDTGGLGEFTAVEEGDFTFADPALEMTREFTNLTDLTIESADWDGASLNLSIRMELSGGTTEFLASFETLK